MDYIVKIMYEESKVVKGFQGPSCVDYMKFDSRNVAEKFINGERVYDYLDESVRLRKDEIPVYLDNANGDILWENMSLKKDGLKVIDYLKFNQFVDGPVSPGEKAAEYIYARFCDYFDDCVGDEIFAKTMTGDNMYSNMLRFYKAAQQENLDDVDEFVSYAYEMLDTELNKNIIANMEKACSEHYNTMLSSDIEYLLKDAPYEEVIAQCETERGKSEFTNITIRSLNEGDYAEVEALDELSGNGVADMVDCEEYAWGVFVEEELVGYCTIGGADEPAMGYDEYPQWTNESLLLSDVFIKEEYRGHGLALRLINEALEKGNPENESVFITLLDDNLCSLYKRVGFRFIEEGNMVKECSNKTYKTSLEERIQRGKEVLLTDAENGNFPTPEPIHDGKNIVGR